MWTWRVLKQGQTAAKYGTGERETVGVKTSEDILRNVEFLLMIKQLILKGSDFNFGLGVDKENQYQTCLSNTPH